MQSDNPIATLRDLSKFLDHIGRLCEIARNQLDIRNREGRQALDSLGKTIRASAAELLKESHSEWESRRER